VKSREEAESETYRNRVWDLVYRRSLYSLEPNAAIILIMTRWHEDDLAGRILASEDASEWTVISLPAEAEDDDILGRELARHYARRVMIHRLSLELSAFWAPTHIRSFSATPCTS